MKDEDGVGEIKIKARILGNGGGFKKNTTSRGGEKADCI